MFKNLIKNNLLELLFIFPFVNDFFFNIILVLILLLSIINYRNSIKNFYNTFFEYSWLIIPFLLFLFFLNGFDFYSINLLNFWGPYIIFYFILILNIDKYISTKIACNIFYFSTVSIFLISFIKIYLSGTLNEMFNYNLGGSNYRLLIDKGIYFPINPIYGSIFIEISFVCFFYIIVRLSKDNKFIKLNYFLYFTSFLFLIFCFLLISSKSGYITLVFIVLFFLKRSKFSFLQKSTFLLFIFSSLVLIIYKVEFIYQRFVEVYINLNLPKGLSFGSTNIRIAIHKCIYDLFYQKPIFGYGYSKIKDNLQLCFSHFDTTAFDNTIYYTHNNFFFILLGSGMFGLIVFIAYLYKKYNLIQKEDNSFIIFLFWIVIIHMVFEDFYLRQKGIVLFSYISFLFYLLKNKKVYGLNI